MTNRPHKVLDYEHVDNNPFQVQNPNDNSSNMKIFSCIDMDAFYAQAEARRLGYDDSVPVVVVQWTLTIAVSYAVRKYGVKRMMPIPDIKKLCPHAVFIHVDTIKVGEPFVDPYKRDLKEKLNIKRDVTKEKVNLDYFRYENNKIVEIYRKWCSVVEKASVDESYLDLTKEVYEIYNKGDYEREWKGKFGGGEPYPAETKEDILLMIGTQIVDRIRQEVLSTLKYTCSAGISYNKMLAKLAAGYNKPNDQTVIVKKYTIDTLKPIEIGKLRNFGGKVADAFENTKYKTLGDLQELNLNELENLMKSSSYAKYVYFRCRGFDDEDVKAKTTEHKSIMSMKSFPKKIYDMSGMANAEDLAIGDLCPRIIEFFHETKLVPSTLDLHYYCNITRAYKSKSGPINFMTKEERFYDTLKLKARELIKIVEDAIFPCGALTLKVKGFQKNDVKSYGFDLVTYAKNKQKEKELKKQRQEEEAKEAEKQKESARDREYMEGDPNTILSLGTRLEESMSLGMDDMNNFLDNEDEYTGKGRNSLYEILEDKKEELEEVQEEEKEIQNEVKETVLCEKCNLLVDKEGLTDHYDFHVAQDLDKELNPNKRKYRKLDDGNTVVSFQENKGSKSSNISAESKSKAASLAKKENNNYVKNSKGEEKKKVANGKMMSLDSFFGKK